MNIVNAAEAAGWGGNWLSGWPSHDPAFVAAAFGCIKGETVAGIIHIGSYSHAAPDRPRPDLDKIIAWVET
jgi:nitroreductase